jgi:hypothetical protein
MRQWIVPVLSIGVAYAAAAQNSAPPQRVMNVTQGPETVFAEPVATILPTLVGARATGENGRVGSDLVFWGYERADGRQVFMFACATGPETNCAERVPAICLNSTTVLEQSEAPGTVVRRQCRNVAVAGPGDLRPGCDDRTESIPIAVGLVACG